MKAKVRSRVEVYNKESLANSIPLETPWVIFVDPSDACNFRCIFCPNSSKKLISKCGRSLKPMQIDLYKKIIGDVYKFSSKVKVLRLYKDGEPLLNKKFYKMVEIAKRCGNIEKVDTTTNGSLLNPKRNIRIIEAGLDHINISVNGTSARQYKEITGKRINFERYVDNVAHFYDNRKQCTMLVKINGDLISKDDEQRFLDIFGDISDYISIEHTMNCWSGFNMKKAVQNEEVGIYGQPIREVLVCPYIFYSISINSDGTASLCFLDWNRIRIVGDAKKQSLEEIWNKNPKLDTIRRFFLLKLRKKIIYCHNCSQLSHGQPVVLDDKVGRILEAMEQ